MILYATEHATSEVPAPSNNQNITSPTQLNNNRELHDIQIQKNTYSS